MFTKLSRYRTLPDVVTIDAKGRRLASKSLRPLPEVAGTFLHTLQSADRLDHLAYQYYKQPRKWWRICDANPAFLSPQALLGNEPIVADHFPLAFAGDHPPWGDLVRQLAAHLGVEDVQVVEEIEIAPERQTLAGQQVTVYVERYQRAVIITYNRLNVSATQLLAVIAAAGFTVAQPQTIGRVGKQIVIPPDVVT